MQFTIEYYVTETGRIPAKTFVDGLDPKLQAKTVRTILLLQEHGPHLGEMFSKPIQEGIHELRIQHANHIARIFYFFVQGHRAIMTHGFVKKTQKTPAQEIQKAIRYRADYERRRKAHG